MQEKELIEQVKIFAKYASKDLGQNYLVNEQISKKICSLILPSKNILEIGSGYGSLSYFINPQNYTKLFLNEIDLRSIQFLNEVFTQQSNVEIINKSFLKIDIEKYDLIIGNLPYYITSHVIEKILIESVKLKHGIFMVQKEFLERICGDGKDYGPIKVLADVIGKIKKEFIVSREVFLPKPNVDSAVFTLNITSQYSVTWKKGFFNFLNKMFLHRRKTIFNNLSLYLKSKITAATLLKKTGIENNLRPEQISSQKYVELFENVLK